VGLSCEVKPQSYKIGEIILYQMEFNSKIAVIGLGYFAQLGYLQRDTL
jgi:hypothetical protein